MKKSFVYHGFHRMRLDRFLSESISEFSRSQFKKRIQKCFVNDRLVIKTSEPISDGDVVDVLYFSEDELLSQKNVKQLIPEIVFEDEFVVVFNKKKGEVIHPAPGHLSGTYSDFMKTKIGEGVSLKEFENPNRVGIVHRLDKETNGLFVAARTPDAETHLKNQFRNRTIKKKYYALVHGIIYDGGGVVDAPIARCKFNYKKRVVSDEGKNAITEYRVLERNEKTTLVEVNILTGRTHQIRVHFQHIGHPVCGDQIYKNRTDEFKNLMLCAFYLDFQHPAKEERQFFELKKIELYKYLAEEEKKLL